MDRAEFFSRIIDGYLFCDLNNMSKLDQKKGENGGAAGYPMIATIIPAMELMGGLLQPKPYTDKEDRAYFKFYWEKYLSEIDGIYLGFDDIFYELIRHGTAHTFITKIGISVTKRQPNENLHIYQENGHIMLNVDCTRLYKDFRKSYTLVKRKLRNKSLAKHVQNNIDLLLKQSREKSDTAFIKYLPQALNKVGALQSQSSSSSTTIPSGIAPLNTQTTTYIPDSVRNDMLKNMRSAILTNASVVSGASLMSEESAKSLKRSLDEHNNEPPASLSAMI